MQASTTVPAFVGYIGFGPVDQPMLVQSLADLTEQLGDEGGDETGDTRLATAVAQFFASGGGSEAVVVGTAAGTVSGLLSDPTKHTGIDALAGARGDRGRRDRGARA